VRRDDQCTPAWRELRWLRNAVRGDVISPGRALRGKERHAERHGETWGRDCGRNFVQAKNYVHWPLAYPRTSRESMLLIPYFVPVQVHCMNYVSKSFPNHLDDGCGQRERLRRQGFHQPLSGKTLVTASHMAWATYGTTHVQRYCVILSGAFAFCANSESKDRYERVMLGRVGSFRVRGAKTGDHFGGKVLRLRDRLRRRCAQDDTSCGQGFCNFKLRDLRASVVKRFTSKM
jgi:hypothetical protein